MRGAKRSRPSRAGYSAPRVSLLTSDDLFLFNQGTHYRLHDKLGAHVVSGGTYFAVWAPNARAVSVIGDWNSWHGGRDRLVARPPPGGWGGPPARPGPRGGHKFGITRPAGAGGG